MKFHVAVGLAVAYVSGHANQKLTHLRTAKHFETEIAVIEYSLKKAEAYLKMARKIELDRSNSLDSNCSTKSELARVQNMSHSELIAESIKYANRANFYSNRINFYLEKNGTILPPILQRALADVREREIDVYQEIMTFSQRCS